MIVLCVGDVFGECGLKTLEKNLKAVKKLKNADVIVVNGENASCNGITPQQAERIFDAGADVITLGNHTWGRREIMEYLDDCKYIVRPLNFATQTAGQGECIIDMGKCRVRVIQLVGRCNMNFIPENPFTVFKRELKEDDCINIVDFHAEATSEKAAFAYCFDGKVSAVFGTHTHVQTADERILPQGTGFITDVGMTGAVDSIIGVKPEQSVNFFLGNPTQRYEAADGEGMMCCVVFDIDDNTKKCKSVERLCVK